MSLEQPGLDDFVSDDNGLESESETASNWTPGQTEQLHKCLNCGAGVEQRLVRVLSDNDGRMHRCPECTDSWTQLQYEANGRGHAQYQTTTGNL